MNVGRHLFSRTQHSGCTPSREPLHSAVEINKMWSLPNNHDTVHCKMNKMVFMAVVVLEASYRKTPVVLYHTRSFLVPQTSLLQGSCTVHFLSFNMGAPGTQYIDSDSKLCFSLATDDGDFCISSSSHGKYSNTWKLGTQSVHVLSMWLSAYVCTSFFRKLYFTLHQLDE